MEDFWYQYSTWINAGIAIVIFVLIAWIINWFVSESDKENQFRISEIKKKHGYDIDDVEVFLDKIGADTEDFLKSKGLRKQYEAFSEGKSADFIKSAEAHKDSEETKSTANTALVLSTAAMENSSIKR